MHTCANRNASLVQIIFLLYFTEIECLRLFLQVEKLARECCFFLNDSFPFDEQNLGELFDEVRVGKPMIQSKPVSYVFSLHPPVDVQSGDFAPLLNQNVNKVV